MRLTYSIISAPRTDKKKKDGTCPIYYFIRVGPSVYKVPSTKSISLKDWDEKIKRPKRTDKVLILLDTYLNKKKADFTVYMLTQENLGKQITSTLALSFFKEDISLTLFKFWEKQIAVWQGDYSENTLKSYRSVLKILKEFNPKLNFGDLTYSMIEKFDKYLKEVRHNALNGCSVKHKCLKRIINVAIEKDIIKENPYKKFKIRGEDVQRQFLTIKEVKAVMAAPVPDDRQVLSISRDLFLFSCFTGLRFSDVLRLKNENLKIATEHKIIEIKILKTGRPLVIPLSNEALKLINKYQNHDKSMFAFPRIANPTVNKALKEIMQLANVEKWISFHCARHTLASNHLEIGTPIIQVKDLLGHKRIAETEIYAKNRSNTLSESTLKLDQKYK